MNITVNDSEFTKTYENTQAELKGEKKMTEKHKKLPFDIEPFEETDTPIRFKHDPESRVELKKKRTPLEILSFVMGEELEFFLELCVHNNDIGFFALQVDDDVSNNASNQLQKNSDHDNEDGVNLEIPEKAVEEYLSLPPETRRMYLITTAEEFCVAVIDSAEHPELASTTMFDSGIYEMFLTEAGLDSLHKLGKMINRGCLIFDEWEKQNCDTTEDTLWR